MRKIKTEFMMMWDGLKTRDSERVLVLAATNRPFDLDEAVLRRLPRRLLIDLPDQKNRLKILQVILKDEDVEPGLDLEEIASMTEGFSGSDLKNFCVAAAYRPIRELLKQEKEKEKEKETVEEGGVEDMEIVTEESETPVPKLRSLTMSDFKKAKAEVSASVSEDTFTIAELRKWNQQFGEGGKRNTSTLSYFT
jgi:SpoVK/Ycf46/Vps4 family AAA+-type ATPase